MMAEFQQKKKQWVHHRDNKKLYRMMQRINDALQELKIPYWITGGTLLGAVRHSGVIPWDDDLDICVMQDRLSKLKRRASQQVFRKHGLQFNDFGELNRIQRRVASNG
jgi:phosphorylcholine metabolism protein LicD